jgi:hypothetical protein
MSSRRAFEIGLTIVAGALFGAMLLAMIAAGV